MALALLPFTPSLLIRLRLASREKRKSIRCKLMMMSLNFSSKTMKMTPKKSWKLFVSVKLKPN